MSVFQGDFLGFQLGSDHSYGINITRVSTNDRYQDNLLPQFTDITMQVPGGDGTYYWDTNYTQKLFQIDFAFDDLRDEDIRKLRQMFSSKTVKPLIFDEYPYKKYIVKCAAVPQLRYICFDQDEFRIYKGEGSVQLVAYYPFAFATIDTNIPFKTGGGVVNNLGDLPTNLKIVYNLDTILTRGGSISLKLKENNNDTILGELNLGGIQRIQNDKYILIDTRTQLIEGLDANKKKTGNLYNKYITSGDFFFPPIGRTRVESTDGQQDLEYISALYTPLYY